MSTLNCSSIAAGLVAASCTKLVVAGTGQKVIVLNYYDVDKPNCTVTSNVISAIQLKTDKIGYPFETFENSTVVLVSRALRTIAILPFAGSLVPA
jgi:hypothetical protein